MGGLTPTSWHFIGKIDRELVVYIPCFGGYFCFMASNGRGFFSKYTREFQVGVFAIVAGVMLYLGVDFLKGTDFFARSNRYYARFTNVGGLQVSNSVLVDGLAVGRVDAIEIPNGIMGKGVLVTLLVSKNLHLGSGTKALLASTDLLGGKAIKLMPPLFEGKGEIANNDTLFAEIEKGLTDELAEQAKPMLANLDSVSNELKFLLRSFSGTSRVLEATMGSFAKTSEQLQGTIAQNSPDIHQITRNAAQLTGQLVQTELQLGELMGKLNKFGDTLNAAQTGRTMAALRQTVDGLNTTLKGINQGQGTAGKLVKSDSLYSNLNKSSEALDALLKDMKARPSRYIHFSVFGKKEKK
jgi:phospholipid/cholesterol/gamma-HCH transport system substrate-binding protein